VLVVVALAAGVLVYFVTRVAFNDLPTPTIYALLWLLVLAIAELYLAAVTRARLAGRPGTHPVNPLVVARFVALAKASSIVGAIAAGGYAGYLLWVFRMSSPTASHDVRTAALGIGLSALLVIAAMVLERVCRVPRRDDDDDERPASALH
jgi:hypothetical protein